MRAELIRLKIAAITDAIAALNLTVEFQDARRESQRIKIGRPLSIDAIFACPVESIGPIRMSSPAVGDNSFQALNIAIACVRIGIHEFVRKFSCKLLYGDDYITLEELNNVFFAEEIEGSGDYDSGNAQSAMEM